MDILLREFFGDRTPEDLAVFTLVKKGLEIDCLGEDGPATIGDAVGEGMDILLAFFWLS